VHEVKHTVVMNWNKQLMPVLQQVSLKSSHRLRKPCPQS
jgi:hypothetical protein